MKKRLLTVFVAFAFVSNLSGLVLAQKVTSVTAGFELAKLLPESDAVILVDSRRLVTETLPQVLSSNQPLLSKIEGKISNLKAETGLDLKNFNNVAIGLKSKATSETEIDFAPVLLARGTINSSAIVSVARLASNGKYHTEKVGNRTIYIFSTEKIIEDNKPKNDPKADKSFLDTTIDKVVKGLSKEAALTTYDENTIVIGSLDRVKEMIGNSPRVGSTVLEMLTQKPNSVGMFGAILPDGLSRYIELSDDELGQSLDSVRKLQGSFDVVDGDASLAVTAETLEVKHAEDLEATLTSLQMLGKILLSKSKGADKQVYSRMIENAKISRKEKIIKFDLKVPKSDIDVIVGKK